MIKRALLIAVLLAGFIPQARAQTTPITTLTAAASTCTAGVCLVANLRPDVGGATFTINANAGGNTIQFEASGDGGSTWVALSVTPSNSTTTVTSSTSTGVWQANLAGYTNARIRMSTQTSGNTAVNIYPSTASARTSGGGAGGGVASVVIAGTSNQITATGTCTITSTGTCTLSIPNSPVFTTPIIGAATGTSLLATGLVDGTVPVGISTGASCTLGTTSGCTSVAYNHAYQLNQEATAGTGVTYTLPATAVGKQYCVVNSGTTSVVNIGILTVYPPASSYVIYNGVVNTVGAGGTHGIASGGAAGDGACFVAIDATHWQVWVQSGTWTEN